MNGKGGFTIGDNCERGCGACVFGEIHIGNNVKIVANAIVLIDVSDGCTVVGVRHKLLREENNTYYEGNGVSCNI